jgi:hypothetical protein
MPSSNAPGARQARLTVERLESRDAPSGLQPTAEEQYILEQVNDARASPAAFGAAHGLRLGGIARRPPLAFDSRLIAVAQHVAAGGFGPLDVNAVKAQIRATGDHFVESHSIIVNEAAVSAIIVGEEQAALDRLVGALIAKMQGGRSALLGTPNPLPGSTATPQLYRDVGIGVVHDVAIAIALQPVDSQPRLTGAVFRDANGNGQYDLGEGLGGVTVAVAGVGAVQTPDSGGYTVVLPRAGTFQVTASGGGLTAPLTRTIHARANGNVRLEFAVP